LVAQEPSTVIESKVTLAKHFIYYSHPMETYRTCVEDIMEKAVREQLGEVYHVSGWGPLLDAVDEYGREELKSLSKEMARLSNAGKAASQRNAKKLGHAVTRTLKSRMIIDSRIVLVNPSTLSIKDVESFKSHAFPFFCHGMIDLCETVVAHGYILNETIRTLLLKWLQTRQSRSPGYCKTLCDLVGKSVDMLWSPGTLNEIGYALANRKNVFQLKNEALQKITKKSVKQFKAVEVPFDDQGLHLYNKIWKPAATNAYKEWCQELMIQASPDHNRETLS